VSLYPPSVTISVFNVAISSIQGPRVASRAMVMGEWVKEGGGTT
jgi:hypothetical protein